MSHLSHIAFVKVGIGGSLFCGQLPRGDTKVISGGYFCCKQPRWQRTKGAKMEIRQALSTKEISRSSRIGSLHFASWGHPSTVAVFVGCWSHPTHIRSYSYRDASK